MRRVAITGLGAVAPGGVGIKNYWDLLTAGRSATRTISFYDASPFRSRVAAECDFDPVAAGLTPQEIRRLDRAAQFAVVSTREALADSGLDARRPRPGPDRHLPGQRGRLHHQPGARVRRRQQRRTQLAGRPHLRGPRALPALRAQLDGRRGRHGGRRRGPRGRHLHRVHLRTRLPRARRRADPRGHLRRDDRRRHRGPHLPDHLGLFRRHPRHHPAQRHPGERLPPLRPHPQRTGPRRGRGRPRAGGADERTGTRCAHLRGDRRVRRALQRVPHDRPQAGRPGDGARPSTPRWTRRGSTPPPSTTSTPTAPAPR